MAGITAGQLTTVIVAVFLLETLPVVALRNHRKASYILVFTVATILLIYKAQEFIRYKIADNGI